jgi:hypothetical protein
MLSARIVENNEWIISIVESEKECMKVQPGYRI